MEINFSKFQNMLENGEDQPNLLLQTMHGSNIGYLQGVSDLRFDIGYSELSEISFTIPRFFDNIINPLYDSVIGYKILYTNHYGIYLITNPEVSGDGLVEEKKVHGYSLEKTFERRQLFLAEGVYKFYDELGGDSVLKFLCETNPGWSVGYVSSDLKTKYRYFDQLKEDALSFMYGDLMEKYQCFVVCDVYNKQINCYDISENIISTPVYLTYENLLDQTTIREQTDNIITQLSPYGSDGLSIRSVNPIGADYLINFDYFIQNGDIDQAHAAKIKAWEAEINANKETFAGISEMRASATSLKFGLMAKKTDLQGELDNLFIQQSVIIQGFSLESTQAGKEAVQKKLDGVNSEIKDKKTKIQDVGDKIGEVEAQIDGYTADLTAITDELRYSKYFDNREREVLDHYLIQEDITDETFVATDLDVNKSGKISPFSGRFHVDGEMVKVDYSASGATTKLIYSIKNGKINQPGIPPSSEDKPDVPPLSADIVRGTLDLSYPYDPTIIQDGEFTLSLYLSDIAYGGTKHPSGTLTMYGKYDHFGWNSQLPDETDLSNVINAKSFSFSVNSATPATTYFTVNSSEYQKYSVEKELYDYGVKLLEELALPVFEFDVNSANFIFENEFTPFKDNLQLGRGVYLVLGSFGRQLTRLLGVTIDFNDLTAINLTFSNKFQLINGQKVLKEVIEKTYSTSRNFDAQKYLYDHSSSQTPHISEFMNSSLDAATNTIINSKNQNVTINGAGIQIGGDDKYQMRIVDRMLAITDNGWKTSKLAIGHFATGGNSSYFGVNAEVIAGKLIVGNNLEIESTNSDGTVVQFKVGASGAFLNNAKFILQKGSNGQMIIDPEYGIIAGTQQLFSVDGDKVQLNCVLNGELVDLGDQPVRDPTSGLIKKMPRYTNFLLDAKDGNAYFNGSIFSDGGGSIGGWSISPTGLTSGTRDDFTDYVGLSSKENQNIAIWAGGKEPEKAPFRVDRKGSVTASGTITASQIKIGGENVITDGHLGGKFINAKGISVKNQTGEETFLVSDSGDVTIKGDVTLGQNSKIAWANIDGKPDVATQNDLQGYVKDDLTFDDRVTEITTNTISTTKVLAKYLHVNAANVHGNIRLGGDLEVYETGEFDTSSVGGYLGYTTNVTGEQIGGIHIISEDRNSEVFTFQNGCKMIKKNGYLLSQVYIKDNEFGVGLYQPSNINNVYDDPVQGFVCKTYQENNRTYLSPYASNVADLGTSGIPWDNVYTSNGTVQTSDRRAKSEISYDYAIYEKLYPLLKPSAYHMIGGTSGRVHTGLIAQDIEASLTSLGVTTKDFAAICKGVAEDGTENYGIRYSELVPLNIHMIQKLMKKTSELEARLKIIEGTNGNKGV